jgi:hypothetical protein
MASMGPLVHPAHPSSWKVAAELHRTPGKDTEGDLCAFQRIYIRDIEADGEVSSLVAPIPSPHIEARHRDPGHQEGQPTE